MGYIMDIHYVDLELPIEKKLNSEPTFLGWARIGEHIEPTDRYFNWDEDFIEDLEFLRSSGVRGKILLNGEEGEYEKYVLDDEFVKKFTGFITYADVPDEEF